MANSHRDRISIPGETDAFERQAAGAFRLLPPNPLAPLLSERRTELERIPLSKPVRLRECIAPPGFGRG